MIASSGSKPLPYVDEDSEFFWRGLAAGKVLLQECNACGTLRFPARAICNSCFSFEYRVRAVSGRGYIWSWVRTWQAFMPGFKDEIPYTTVTVRLPVATN